MQIRLARICIACQWPVRQVDRLYQSVGKNEILLVALTGKLECIFMIERRTASVVLDRVGSRRVRQSNQWAVWYIRDLSTMRARYLDGSLA